MQVLIVYEDFAAGRRAMAVLKRVGEQCGGSGRLKHMMWRFDLISDVAFFEAAVTEALASDIVLIAACAGKELPQAVKDWLVRWLMLKGDRPAALVASLDYSRANINCEQAVQPYLSRLANIGKLQFFANGYARDANTNPANVKEKNSPWDFALTRRGLAN